MTGGAAAGATGLAAAAVGAAGAGAFFCLKLALLLAPALVLYEILAPLPIFGRIGRWLAPRLLRLGMSAACTVPLAAGFFLGIAYGAGIIIPVAGERRIGPRELQSLALFLCTCHAIVEDTLLFALVGAGGPLEVAGRMALLASVRLVLAVAVVGGRARFVRPAAA
jgi:hypothetical protein